MKMDAKIIAAIYDMTRSELGAVILGAGYALPLDRSRYSLRNVVLQLYADGEVTGDDILAQYNGGL